MRWRDLRRRLARRLRLLALELDPPPARDDWREAYLTGAQNYVERTMRSIG